MMKILFAILILSFLLTSFFYEKPENVACITNEISMVEKQYNTLPPDTGKKKNEIIIENGGFNINDSIQRAEFRENIDSALINSYTHTKVINDAIVYGVLKASSCGGYPELDVFMDCEDEISQNSSLVTHKFGWTGASYVDGAKNVMLKFCVVDASNNFERTQVDYAVLALGYDIPYGSYVVKKVFTNEIGDHGSQPNSNNTTLNGININYYGLCSFYNNAHKYNYGVCGNNVNINIIITYLTLYYFDKLSNVNSGNFPNLAGLGIINPNTQTYYSGYDYGVFGRFGHHQGYIYTDDEDIDNNKEDGYHYDPSKCKHVYKGNFNGLFDGVYGLNNIIENVNVVNSRIYFSKVDNCYNPY